MPSDECKQKHGLHVRIFVMFQVDPLRLKRSDSSDSASSSSSSGIGRDQKEELSNFQAMQHKYFFQNRYSPFKFISYLACKMSSKIMPDSGSEYFILIISLNFENHIQNLYECA